MTTKEDTLSKRVSDNTMLTALARLMMVFGVPIVLTVLFWAANMLWSLNDARTDILRRLQIVETQNSQDLRVQEEANKNITSVLVSQARTEGLLNAISGSIARIDRTLERRPQ